MLGKKIALGFAIAVVFPMLIHYGVSTFVPKPSWQDYHQGVFNPNPTPQEKAKLQETQKEYQAREKRFQQYLFGCAVPLGLVALLIGAFMRLPAIGTGLMFGGIFSICDGYFNHWSALADALKFVSLVIAFGLLLFLGFRRVERKEI